MKTEHLISFSLDSKVRNYKDEFHICLSKLCAMEINYKENISGISTLPHTLNLGKTESRIIKSLKSKKDPMHYSVLTTTPNHLCFSHDSLEYTWALIKMSLIHISKSLHYIPITFTIIAILLFKVNSIICGENHCIYNGVHLSSFHCQEDWRGVCHMKTAFSNHLYTEKITSLSFKRGYMHTQSTQIEAHSLYLCVCRLWNTWRVH